MNTKDTAPRPSAPKALPASTANGQATPVWIRLGVPAACAVMAAVFNFAAIKRQTQPIRAYTLSHDLTMGTRLEADHLQLVDLAGSFDRSAVVLEEDLLVREGSDGKALPLSTSLERRPRILVRHSRKGEILIKSSLGGIESPRPNEETVEVRRSMLNASDDLLTPGRIVNFLVQNQARGQELGKPQLIGPFRVAWEDYEITQSERQSRREEWVRLAYRLDKDGKATPSAQILRQAIINPASYSLYGQLPSPPPPQKTQPAPLPTLPDESEPVEPTATIARASQQ